MAEINTLYEAKKYAYRQESLNRIIDRIRSSVARYAADLEQSNDQRGQLALFQTLIYQEPDYLPYYLSLAEVQVKSNRLQGAIHSLNMVVHDPELGSKAKRLLARIEQQTAIDLEDAIEIPLRRSGDHFLVESRVNDLEPMLLLIDTGASITILKSSALQRLGIDESTAQKSRWINTVNGRIRAPIVKINSLSVSGVKIADLDAGIVELDGMPGIDGLLGMNFLRNFRFYIDQTENTLHLSP